MLIAWTSGKKRSKAREYEDEIVSAIFGPLLCAPPTQRGEVFRQIIKSHVPDLPVADGCTITFWPNLTERGRIEPDMVVVLKSAGEKDTVLIIEAKWGAGQSDNQLSKQWQAAQERYHDQSLWHIFLTKQSHNIQEMLGNNRPNEGHSTRLISLTWHSLAYMLMAVSKSKELTDLREWSTHACKFLHNLGQAPFVGVLSVVDEHRDWESSSDVHWHFQPKLIRTAQMLKMYQDWVPVWLINSWNFQRAEKNYG